MQDLLVVDNKEPLSSGQHRSEGDGANWAYTKSITSSDYYSVCASGLMVSLSSINSNIFKQDELIAVTAEPSAIYYGIDVLSSSQKKADGLNLEWLMKEHDSTEMSMTYTNKMMRFNTPLEELPMMNDIRTVNVRIELLARFSEDTGWYDYSDWSRAPHWEQIATTHGLGFGLVVIRAVLKNCEVVSGCVFINAVFPEMTRDMGIDAPAYCFPEHKAETCVYFNGDTARTMTILGAPASENP